MAAAQWMGGGVVTAARSQRVRFLAPRSQDPYRLSISFMGLLARIVRGLRHKDSIFAPVADFVGESNLFDGSLTGVVRAVSFIGGMTRLELETKRRVPRVTATSGIAPVVPPARRGDRHRQLDAAGIPGGDPAGWWDWTASARRE